MIDDDRLIVTAVERSFNAEYDVVCASSAETALALITSGSRFDAILCDLMMPDMTGMDLHTALETLNPEQAKRIIFLSGGAFTHRTHAFLERVSNPYLEKPFDMPQLRALVDELIQAGTAPK